MVPTAIPVPVAPASISDARAGKYLTFRLLAEEFGVRVTSVREIMGLQPITAVPQTPDYVKGVINLRGKVVPVIDLRRRFGMEPADYDARTCIVVVQVQGEVTQALAGLIVDAVSEVVSFTAADIEDTPDFGGRFSSPYLLGMAKIRGRVRILLDIERVVSGPGLADIGVPGPAV